MMGVELLAVTLDPRPRHVRLADAEDRLDEAIIRRWTRIVEAAPPTPGWDQHGTCLGLPTEVFYADNRTDRDAVLDCCRQCPVVVDCLRQSFIDEAERQNIHGTLGGLTATQRREWWRRRGDPHPM